MYAISQLRDYSTLFTRSEIFRLLENDFDSIDAKINRYSLDSKFKGNTYLELYKDIYNVLLYYYPNEYIFKNQFLNTWLINELGDTDSVIYNELRLGKVIADLAMFNGVSKVFEIKTPLDKEYRLSNQLDSYRKIFNEVYLIIPLNLFDKYESFDVYCGIITYDNSHFTLKREAKRNLNIDVDLLMQIVHTREYIQIVSDFYSFLPKMDAFTQFDICRDLISNIPYDELNRLFLKTMKKRKLNNLFFKETNNQFNQVCLALNFNNKQKKILIDNLKTKFIS